MNQKPIFWLLGAVVVLMIGVASWRFVSDGGLMRLGPLARQDGGAAVSESCSHEFRPVCGIDGITYDNECYAVTIVGVEVEREGACSRTTQLSSDERKYLLWLLRARDQGGLAAVAVRHRATRTDDDQRESIRFYYEWGQGIIARITITSDTVVEAVDSEGFNYLAQAPGVPVTFPELDDSGT